MDYAGFSSNGNLYVGLQKKGYTEELPRDELGFKRYCYTEKGKRFLKQQIEIAKDFMHKIEFLVPMLVGGLNFEDGNKKFLKSKESAIKLVKSFISLRQNLNNLSEKDVKELSEILDESSAKIKQIIQRTKIGK